MPCAPRISRHIPVELRIVAEVPAGAGFGGHVGAGEAARIFTGAPLPAGTDTIVIQEDTERDGDRVRVLEGAPRGRYVRREGLDFAEGEELLRRGRRLTARDIGLAGGDEPAVALRPSPAAHRHPVDRRRDRHAGRSDRTAPDRQLQQPLARRLCRRLRRCAGIGRQRPGRSRGAAPDCRRDERVDLLVTTGGVSVGEHDLVREALAADGFELDFWQIAMRPGKPLMVGRYRGTPMVGLPGNPVSTLVCSLLFLKPALDRLSGAAAETESTGHRPPRQRRSRRTTGGRIISARASCRLRTAGSKPSRSRCRTAR